jgi:hypothetical protein
LPSERQNGEIEGIAVFLTSSEVFHEVASPESLRQILEKLPIIPVLRATCKLNAILANTPMSIRDSQIALVQQLLDNPARERALSLLYAEQDRRAFFEEQLVGMAKQAILYCQRDTTRDLTADEAKDFYRALFMVSELIGRQQEATGDDYTDVVLSTLRSLYFNQKEPSRHLLTRYFDLLFLRPELPKHLASVNRVDLQSAFLEATEIDISDFIAAGMVLYAHVSRFKLPNDFGRYRIDMPWAELGLKLTGDDAEVRFVRRIAQTIETFAESFRKQGMETSVLGSSLMPFFQAPVAQLPGDALAVLSNRLLLETVTEGIYWTLHEHFRRQDSSSLNRFTRYFGELFEGQLVDRLAGIYPDSPSLAKRFFPEIAYGRGQGSLSSDAMVVYGDSVVFLEAFSGRVRYQDTVLRGGLDEFHTDVEKCVIAKAKQVARVIEDFHAGTLEIPGVNPSEIKKAYPVVVLLEPFPEFPTTWLRIDQRLQEERLFQDTNPLQLLSMESVELIEPLLRQGQTLVYLLDEKIKDPEFRNRSMKSFLAAKSLTPRMLDQRLDATWDEFRAMIHSRLSETSTTDKDSHQSMLSSE